MPSLATLERRGTQHTRAREDTCFRGMAQGDLLVGYNLSYGDMQPPAITIPESGRICGIDRLSCLRCLLPPSRRVSVTRKPEKATQCHIGRKEINKPKHPQKSYFSCKARVF